MSKVERVRSLEAKHHINFFEDEREINGKKVVLADVSIVNESDSDLVAVLNPESAEKIINSVIQTFREIYEDGKTICPIWDFRKVSISLNNSRQMLKEAHRMESAQQFMGPQVILIKKHTAVFNWIAEKVFQGSGSNLTFVSDEKQARSIRDEKIEQYKDKVEDSSGSLEP